MPPIFSIRQGTSEDASRLAALAAQVWLHTYATEGINNDVAQYVLSEFTVEKSSKRLVQPKTTILVAEYDAHLVGFAAIQFGTPCPSCSKAVVELETLYVQEHCIGRGIGAALLRAAEVVVREQSASPLWLAVNAQNAQAIAFYLRHGYSQIGTTLFALGQGHHENLLLVGGAQLERQELR
jgi:ribosomal protein S18 acetylase RimI-like enzyme